MKTSVYPRKAIILAAGFGTRMMPLSAHTPKPVMPVWGRPIVEHTLRILSEWGVAEVLINLHHNPSPLLDYFRKNPVCGMKIEFSFEPEILGTGGAIRKASWFLENSPFWMINTDITAEVSPEPFLNELLHGWAG